MLNIIIFGPPGAGKGTQSAKLVEKYQLVHLSTGDILRGEITAGTILGQEAKLLMDQGILVPDEIVITMINNKLQQNALAKGFIFDGFPRTTAQAEALDRLLSAKGTSIGMTLALDISEEELIKRILQRGTELGRTDDQETGTIKKRIAEYTNKTSPLKDYYTKQRKFHSISGRGSIDEIFHALCSKIDTLYHPESSHVAVHEQTVIKTLTPATVQVAEKTVKHLEVVAPALVKKVVVKKPASTKKDSKKKGPVKKASLKKASPKKLIAKKASAAKKASPAKKVSAAKKAPKKKVVSKKAAPKKVQSKKTTPKKKKATPRNKPRRK